MKFSFNEKQYDTDSPKCPINGWDKDVKYTALIQWFDDEQKLQQVLSENTKESLLFELLVQEDRERNFLEDITGGEFSQPGIYSEWIRHAFNKSNSPSWLVSDDLKEMAESAENLDNLKKDILNYAKDLYSDHA